MSGGEQNDKGRGRNETTKEEHNEEGRERRRGEQNHEGREHKNDERVEKDNNMRKEGRGDETTKEQGNATAECLREGIVQPIGQNRTLLAIRKNGQCGVQC